MKLDKNTPSEFGIVTGWRIDVKRGSIGESQTSQKLVLIGQHLLPELSGINLDPYPEVYQGRVDYLQISTDLIPALEIGFPLTISYIMYLDSY